MKTSKPRISKQRSIDAAVAAFNTACLDSPIKFDQHGNSETLDGYDRGDYETILVRLINTGTTLLTIRAFTVARVWNARIRPPHGQGRAILRRLFPEEWRRREIQIYEWCRIVKLVPPDDVDYTKPWEYYRRVYGRTSDVRRNKWQDVRVYRDGDDIVFVEARNGREEIHAKPVAVILALLADQNGVIE